MFGEFRLWNIKEETWMEKESLGAYAISSKGILLASNRKTSPDESTYTPLLGLNKDVAVEFCIGRKDNDGKDVYVGDIIYYKEPDTSILEGSEMYLIIKYDEETASFRGVSEWWGAMPIHDDVTMLVVGNIHDNPELIEYVKKGVMP